MPTPAPAADPAPRTEPNLNLTHVVVSFGLVLAAMLLILRTAELDEIAFGRDAATRSLASTRQRVVRALSLLDGQLDPATTSLLERGGLRRVMPQASVSGKSSELPRLTAEAREIAAKAPGSRTLAGRVVLESVELTGLVKLAPGANVLLRDVVLHGSLVSAAELDRDPAGAVPGPIVRVQGSLRIESGSHLPGVAIFLPAGSLIADEHSRLQIHGDVIARGAEFSGGGVVSGELATLVAPQLSTRVEHVRPGRGLEIWSPALEFAAPDQTPEVADRTSWPEVASMTRFQFP